MVNSSTPAPGGGWVEAGLGGLSAAVGEAGVAAGLQAESRMSMKHESESSFFIISLDCGLFPMITLWRKERMMYL
jgi:hypothetical protein